MRPSGQSACRLQHFCSSLTCDEQEQEANGKCMGTIEAWDGPLAVSQATVAGGAGFKAASWSVYIAGCAFQRIKGDVEGFNRSVYQNNTV